jgi:hypothetical protein
MKFFRITLCIAAALLATPLFSAWADKPGRPEEPIELPEVVSEVLEQLVPGIEIVEIALKGNGKVYHITGTSDGARVKVKIEPDGTVQEIEEEEGEDEGVDSEGDSEDSQDDSEDAQDDGEDAQDDGEDAQDDGAEEEDTEGDDEGTEEDDKKPNGKPDRGNPEELPLEIVGALQDSLTGLVVEKFDLRGGGPNQFYMIEGTIDGEPVRLKVSLDGEITQLGSDDEEMGDDEEVEEEEDDDGENGDGEESEDEEDDEKDTEKNHGERGRTTISVGDIPLDVSAILEDIAKGIEITKVQLEKDGESEVYIIKGNLDGHTVKLEIASTGEVVGKGKGDVDDDPDPLNGCTRGTGYWKNHLDDPAWALIGAETLFFLSDSTYAEILRQPSKGDAYLILARTYIGARLNEANGVTPTAEIQTTLDLASIWFETIAQEDRPIRPNTDDGKTALAFAEMLDSFNRGLLGASNCDGESKAPGEDDEPGEENEDEETEGEETGEEGNGDSEVTFEDVSPLEVDLKDLPEQAKAAGLAGSMQLKIQTEPDNYYRFECLNLAQRWQPLGGKFRGDGTEKVVRVPLGRDSKCTMFRVKIIAIAAGGDAEPAPEEEGALVP